MILKPQPKEDTSVWLCLLPDTTYSILGVEGGFCANGWFGASLDVVDIYGEVLAEMKLTVESGCSLAINLTIKEDAGGVTPGPVTFKNNRATGTLQSSFCGLGCGGAVYLGEVRSRCALRKRKIWLKKLIAFSLLFAP